MPTAGDELETVTANWDENEVNDDNLIGTYFHEVEAGASSRKVQALGNQPLGFYYCSFLCTGVYHIGSTVCDLAMLSAFRRILQRFRKSTKTWQA